MVNRSQEAESARQCLSALMDGHLEAGAADQACCAWRDDPAARERWHTYHLIGDVLRSDELAGAPARDAAFVRALRRRLAREPVPLAPAAAPVPVERRDPRRRWLMAPVAVAAGFVAVAGALMITRLATPEGEVDRGPARIEAMAKQAAPEVVAASGQLIRDARLDRYLAAHRQLSYGAAVVVPGAVVRSVDTIVLERR